MNNPGTFTPTFLVSAARRALPLLGTLLLASLLAGCPEPLRMRKNVKDLTAQEKQDFVDAVLKLKATPSPYDSNLNWYDQFVEFHRQVYYYKRCKALDPQGNCMSDALTYEIGHKSPTFLPWHRKFLLMYEQALSEVSGKEISLPYWDWTDGASTDAVFAEGFMGPGGDEAEGHAVLRGHFRKGNWKINVFPEGDTTPHLVRSTLEDRSTLPTADDIKACREVDTYDAAPWDSCVDSGDSFRSCIEGWGHHASMTCAQPSGEQPPPTQTHNSAHVWVGGMAGSNGQQVSGSMAAFDTSPNDPAFFLHHAYVDRVWAQWQQDHGTSYIPGDGREGWNPPDSLFPFNQHPEDTRVKLYGNTVGDMLDVRELGYEYR